MFGRSLFSIVTGLALLVVALMDLTGCSPGGGDSKSGGGTPADQVVTGKATDARITLENLFTAQEEVKEVPASFMTRGCVTEGKSIAAEGYDPSLRAGQVIKERRVGSDSRGTSDVEVEMRLRDAKKMELVVEEEYVKFNIPNAEKITAPAFLKSPHYVRRLVLTKKDNNGSSYISEEDEIIEDGLNPEFLKQLREQPSLKNYNCQIDYTSETNKPVYESKIHVGTTRMMGLPVKSLQYSHITRGDIVCRDSNVKDAPEIKLGEGQAEHVSVRTNQVLALGYNFCGGQGIYFSSIIKLKDGRIVESFANRVESAPVVR